ncbi:GntR family transcriptional regulator [Cryobacterium sp. TMS1-13-1]|uniref:GntR family transcriptional regulator n=1 Tax=Cryobacterium sp. TMS1-13-1 TaxID=1259220 RepID=UPI00106C1F6F|nr:GntR family transcriptional regulator [Cryobacterium sp. TMS1-13-1]TFD25577.1 GntR family transcriptional regulator [Cryobacterium sp. TMS1-13-1]
MLSIQKVEQGSTLRDRIAQSLAAAINTGELAPGTLVTVPTLAIRFEVSATPAREAMLDLEQRGFVTSVRNKGFRMTQMSDKDLRDVIELRQLLEAPTMGALAGTLDAETLTRWRGVAEQISEYARQKDLAGFLAADRQFHLGLLALHGSARLVEMVGELRAQTRMVSIAAMMQSDELWGTAREHHVMLDLLASGESEALRELTVSHLGTVAGWSSDPAGPH